MNGGGKNAEAGFGQREKSWSLCSTARHAEHRAKEIVEVAERVALRCLLGIETYRGVRRMPVLVRKRGLLREQHGEDKDKAA